MKKQTIRLLFFSTLLSCLFLTACHKKEGQKKKPSSSLTKVTFVLDWTPNTNHTGLFVAKKEGFYKKEGLDVNLIQPADGDASTLVGSQKAQFGISAQDTLAPNFSEKKIPILAIATLLQHNTSGILSRKGEGLHRPKGLEHKTYATWDSPIEQAMLKNVMKKDQNSAFSKVTLIPNNIVDEPLALKEKQADALWVFYGWGGIKATLDHVPTDYFSFKTLNPTFDYYTPVIIANQSFVKTHPALTKKFLKATKKGYEYAITHEKKGVKDLLQASPELDYPFALKSQRWINTQYKADEKRWGYIDQKRWDRFYSWLNENHLVTHPISAHAGFTNKYLP